MEDIDAGRVGSPQTGDGVAETGDRVPEKPARRGRGRPPKIEAGAGKPESIKPIIDSGDSGPRDDGDGGDGGSSSGRSSDRGIKVKRARKKKKAQDTLLSEAAQLQVASFFHNLNNELAESASVPELSISETDAARIVESTDKVLAYFAPEVALSEGHALVIGLVFTVGMIYGPGLMKVVKRKGREKREAEAKQVEADKEAYETDRSE